MASKARQSVFGGFLGLSLNLVILPFFMRLRSSCGYDANDVASQRIGDEEHSAVDQTDGVEARLASGVEGISAEPVTAWCVASGERDSRPLGCSIPRSSSPGEAPQ